MKMQDLVLSWPFETKNWLQMKKFYQSKKSQSTVVTAVAGHQVPLYGGVSVLSSAGEHPEAVAVPMNLTFVMRSRAHILGKLVRSKFDRLIRCSVTLRGNELGKPLDLTNLCIYRWSHAGDYTWTPCIRSLFCYMVNKGQQLNVLSSVRCALVHSDCKDLSILSVFMYMHKGNGNLWIRA